MNERENQPKNAEGKALRDLERAEGDLKARGTGGA